VADGEALRASPSLGEERALDEREWRRIPEHLKGSRGAAGPEARARRFWRERYAAGVRVLDRHVAALRAELEARGLFDSTVFAFTSDHGEELLERGGFDHGHALFAEQTHVPLVVRLPGGAQAGSRRAELVSTIDLPARLFGWAGLGVPAAFERAASDVALASAVKWQPDTLALRDRGHLLLHERVAGEARWRLFNLAHDPLEERDLARAEPEVLTRLQARLAQHWAALKASQPLWAGELVVSPELEAELRQLGY
jgi:arylsulfatase A-like enzyme